MLKVYHFKSVALLLVLCGLCLAASAQEHTDSLIAQGIDKMQHEKYRASIELLLQAKTASEKSGSYRQQFLANNNIGANYFAILDYGEALTYYMQGYNIATRHLDDSYKMTALNNIAILYSKEQRYDKALEYFSMAYKYALSQKDDQRAGLYIMNIGILAYEQGDYPKAGKCMGLAIGKVKRKSDQLLIRLTLARIELRRGNTIPARQAALAALEEFRNSEFKDLLLNLQMVVAESYLEEARFGDAITILDKSLPVAINPETRRELFRLLSASYEGDGNYRKALVLRDSVYESEIKINQARNEHAFQYNKLRFEIEDYKNREQFRLHQIEMQRKIFVIVIVLLLIMVTIVTMYLRAKAQKKKLLAQKKQQQVLLELTQEKNEKLMLEKDMREKQAQATIEKEELNAAVLAKNKELSLKAFSLSKRNELIEEIISTFSKIPEFSENHLFISYLKRLKKEVSSSEEWDDFTRHFNELNYEFVRKLKDRHPTLSKNDVRFIIYVYMNLTTKEISNLVGITNESTRKRKERIAVKMGLQSSRLLYDYIIDI